MRYAIIRSAILLGATLGTRLSPPRQSAPDNSTKLPRPRRRHCIAARQPPSKSTARCQRLLTPLPTIATRRIQTSAGTPGAATASAPRTATIRKFPARAIPAGTCNFSACRCGSAIVQTNLGPMKPVPLHRHHCGARSFEASRGQSGPPIRGRFGRAFLAQPIVFNSRRTNCTWLKLRRN